MTDTPEVIVTPYEQEPNAPLPGIAPAMRRVEGGVVRADAYPETPVSDREAYERMTEYAAHLDELHNERCSEVAELRAEVENYRAALTAIASGKVIGTWTARDALAATPQKPSGMALAAPPARNDGAADSGTAPTPEIAPAGAQAAGARPMWTCDGCGRKVADNTPWDRPSVCLNAATTSLCGHFQPPPELAAYLAATDPHPEPCAAPCGHPEHPTDAQVAATLAEYGLTPAHTARQAMALVEAYERGECYCAKLKPDDFGYNEARAALHVGGHLPRCPKHSDHAAVTP